VRPCDAGKVRGGVGDSDSHGRDGAAARVGIGAQAVELSKDRLADAKGRQLEEILEQDQQARVHYQTLPEEARGPRVRQQTVEEQGEGKQE
jgi:hypothetical protein